MNEMKLGPVTARMFEEYINTNAKRGPAQGLTIKSWLHYTLHGKAKNAMRGYIKRMEKAARVYMQKRLAVLGVSKLSRAAYYPRDGLKRVYEVCALVVGPNGEWLPGSVLLATPYLDIAKERLEIYHQLLQPENVCMVCWENDKVISIDWGVRPIKAIAQ